MDFEAKDILIGVIGSLLGAAIIAMAGYIINYLFKSTFNRVYREKVKNANKDIFISIMTLVTQRIIPNIDIINSLKKSIADKNKVDHLDLVNNLQLKDDIITEIIQNNFLSVQERKDLCDQINNTFQNKKMESPQIENTNFRKKYQAEIHAIWGVVGSLFLYIYMQWTFKVSDIGIGNIELGLLIFCSMITILFTVRIKKNKKIDEQNKEINKENDQPIQEPPTPNELS